MQNLQRFFGFSVSVTDYLTPEHERLYKTRAIEALELGGMLPDDYFVYFHQLSINADETHFDVSGGLKGRIKELTITFNVNKKQRQMKKIRFINHFV